MKISLIFHKILAITIPCIPLKPFWMMTGISMLFLWASCKTQDAEVTPIQELDMVDIAAGNCLLGSDRGFWENETPRVSISLNTFQMSRHEVTQYQYRTVLHENPSFKDGDNFPVEQVSWQDALRFCNALSLQEKLEPAYQITADTVIWIREANGFRLPTEAEWEYACKAGTETDLFTGDLNDLYLNLVTENLDSAGWFVANAENSTHPAGTKQANGFGLYDMHGNVWEWCWDYFNSERYLTLGPSPVDDRISAHRVLRGGSFFNDIFNARSALRYYGSPDDKNLAIGFRVARNGR